MSTEAQRAAGRKAGRASGIARGTGTRVDQPGQQEPDPDFDPAQALPVTSDPDVDKMIASYVSVVGPPQSWPDVKNLEQVRAEIYRTRSAARQDAIDAGQVVTREIMRTRDEEVAQIIKQQLATLPELLRDLIPADKLLAAQKRADEWIGKVRTAVADGVEGMK